MKFLFNCSYIKNVCLKDDKPILELEITYTDNEESRWISRRNISDIAGKEYHIKKYAKQYEKIKEALLNQHAFVEIVL